MGKRYSGSSWTEADAFIDGGRTPLDGRPAGRNRRLNRRGNGDIEFILHTTPVVTYHKGDGMQTIYMGGWPTVTTKADINYHSNARLHSVYHHVKDAAGNDMKGTLALWHPSDRVSPPKIQKCRKCHGTAELRTVCRPGRYHNDWWMDREWRDAVWAALPGMTYQEPEMRIAWTEGHTDLFGKYHAVGDYVRDEDGRMVHEETGVMLDRVRRREDTKRFVCEHGFFEPHFDYNPCYNCSGTGKVDHGGRQIPTPIGSHERVLIHPDGRVWKPIEDWVAMIAGLRRTRRRNAS